jgi:hypothetical protein
MASPPYTAVIYIACINLEQRPRLTPLAFPASQRRANIQTLSLPSNPQMFIQKFKMSSREAAFMQTP